MVGDIGRTRRQSPRACAGACDYSETVTKGGSGTEGLGMGGDAGTEEGNRGGGERGECLSRVGVVSVGRSM